MPIALLAGVGTQRSPAAPAPTEAAEIPSERQRPVREAAET